MRFENLVAGHLLKWTHHEQDAEARFPKCQAWQISAVGTRDYVTPDGIRVAPAIELLRGLV